MYTYCRVGGGGVIAVVIVVSGTIFCVYPSIRTSLLFISAIISDVILAGWVDDWVNANLHCLECSHAPEREPNTFLQCLHVYCRPPPPPPPLLSSTRVILFKCFLDFIWASYDALDAVE